MTCTAPQLLDNDNNMKTTDKKVEESSNDFSDVGTPRVEMTCTDSHLLENNMKTTDKKVEESTNDSSDIGTPGVK